MWLTCFMAVLYEAKTLVHTHMNTTEEEKYNDRQEQKGKWIFFHLLVSQRDHIGVCVVNGGWLVGLCVGRPDLQQPRKHCTGHSAVPQEPIARPHCPSPLSVCTVCVCMCVCVCVCIFCIVTLEPMSILCVSFFLLFLLYIFYCW